MYFIGLDLGKRQDPTAVALVERPNVHPVYGTRPDTAIRVLGLERVPLGTPYLLVVERIRRLIHRPELADNCGVVVDATGVGAPVVEALRAALSCEVAAVVMTSGEKGNEKGRDFTVPKQDLLMGLQVLLERGELRIAAGLRDAPALVKELISVRGTVKDSGRLRLGADRFGEHDDLVIAVALATWRAQRQKFIGMGSNRLPGI